MMIYLEKRYSMDFISILGIVAFVIILVILLCYISIYNSLKRASIKIDEADSGIDIALTKRYDVITKMVEVVKGYAKHEKETLFEVINLRKNMTLGEKSQENDKMTHNLDKINVVVESYPKLKADENFKILQKTIIDVEEHLQAARRMYNSNVSIYNQMIEVFPKNIVAKMNNMVRRDFFEASEVKKENVKIKL